MYGIKTKQAHPFYAYLSILRQPKMRIKNKIFSQVRQVSICSFERNYNFIYKHPYLWYAGQIIFPFMFEGSF